MSRYTRYTTKLPNTRKTELLLEISLHRLTWTQLSWQQHCKEQGNRSELAGWCSNIDSSGLLATVHTVPTTFLITIMYG